MSVRSTSIEAYTRHVFEGKVTDQQLKILGKLFQISPKSLGRRELSEHLNLELCAVCGRVNELVNNGSLVEVDQRICPFTGRNIYPLAITKFGQRLL